METTDPKEAVNKETMDETRPSSRLELSSAKTSKSLAMLREPEAGDMDVNSIKEAIWLSTGEELLQIDDIGDAAPDNAIVAVEAKALRRNASLLSMHSKSESIKTDLEESAERTPEILCRSQSAKSLIIKEEISDLTESESKTNAEVVAEFCEDITGAGNEFASPVKSMSSRSRSPTIAD